MIVQHTVPASLRLLVTALAALLVAYDAAGQSATETAASNELVSYDAAFFERYQPNTALDMINQLPGFVLDDGSDTRGFASSGGNILIDDRRPSIKQDLPSDILARIPASQVEVIEVIRAQVRDIDLQGQAIVANVILLESSEAAVRWNSAYRYNVDFGSTLELAMSVSDQWGATEYNTGFDLRRNARGDFTPYQIFDGQGAVVEERFDVGDVHGTRGVVSFSAARAIGETRLRFNTQVDTEVRDSQRDSDRTRSSGESMGSIEEFPEDLEFLDIEIGIDAERNLGENLIGKAILIHFDGEQDLVSTQRSFTRDGDLTRERISDSNTLSSETIARAEFNWTNWPNHVLQFNIEGAFNELDNELVQTVDSGDGPVIVDVPGSDSRVKERRSDILFKDTWSLGAWEIEYGVGFERSTIEQSGDAELKRTFTYTKPLLALTHAPYVGMQTRVRASRDVSQLDFNDFVSATVFEDDDLALGNPDLQPETTWRLEISHERRFGQESVVTLIGFHDWVDDVEDLLPLSPSFEAPGNIGDGRRWGLEFKSTLPLDRLRLRAAKLDVNVRWQDSTVVDPVTGDNRVFSIGAQRGKLFPLEYTLDTEYALAVDFRQDFETRRMAWGWDVRSRAERLSFRVNEFVSQDEGTELNVFLETTRWRNIKMNLSAQNIFNIDEDRIRVLYVEERGLSPVERREVRARRRGFRFALEVGGNF